MHNTQIHNFFQVRFFLTQILASTRITMPLLSMECGTGKTKLMNNFNILVYFVIVLLTLIQECIKLRVPA